MPVWLILALLGAGAVAIFRGNGDGADSPLVPEGAFPPGSEAELVAKAMEMAAEAQIAADAKREAWSEANEKEARETYRGWAKSLGGEWGAGIAGSFFDIGVWLGKAI